MSAADEVLMPPVKKLCKRCPVYQSDVDTGFVVISPPGTAHDGAQGGKTHCGLDATGDGWWWPL